MDLGRPSPPFPAPTPLAGVALRTKRSVAGSVEESGGGVLDDGIGDVSGVFGNACGGGGRGSIEGAVEDVCQASTGGEISSSVAFIESSE